MKKTPPLLQVGTGFDSSAAFNFSLEIRPPSACLKLLGFCLLLVVSARHKQEDPERWRSYSVAKKFESDILFIFPFSTVAGVVD